jgi:hypothetical protein
MIKHRLAVLVCTLLLGSAGVASCRDYTMRTETAQGDAGERAFPGPGGGAPPLATDGFSGEGGNRQGDSFSGFGPGPTGGAAEPGHSAGAAGQVDPSAGAGNTPVDTGKLGAVRLFIDGEPVCGGTLVNNHWVLTADSCVPSDNLEISVAYGANSSNPDQVESVKKVVRFPGNDGTTANRGRDLLLLGLEQSMQARLDSVDIYLPLLNMPDSGFLLYPQTCVSWDLSPEPNDDTHVVRSVGLTPFAVDSNTTLGSRATGDLVWWSRQSVPGIASDVLPTNADIGSGCFMQLGLATVLTSVITGVPDRRRDGRDNPALEARSVGTSSDEIRAWFETSMFDVPQILPLQPLGPLCAQWSTPESLEILGVSQDTGAMLWLTREHEVWGDAVDLGAPDGAVLSKTLRPAGLWRTSGSVEIFAVDSTGRLWWKRRRELLDELIWTDWVVVDVATTTVTSGVRIGEAFAGHFHIAARGPSGELRHAQFEDGHWHESWDDLRGNLRGEPSLMVLGQDRVSAYYTSTNGTLLVTYLLGGKQSPWYTSSFAQYGTIASAPATGSWSANMFDLVARTTAGTLGRLDYRGGYHGSAWLDTGFAMPDDTDPYVALRSPGHGDLFVSTDDGSVWHVAWPRKP